MIGLDTNVVVRLLTQDDDRQYKKAAKAINELYDASHICFINSVVLVETCWVLEKAYSYSKDLIIKDFKLLLQIKEIELEHTEEVWKALNIIDSSNIGFADAYIGLINRKKDCNYTLTFDKKAAATDDFQLL